MQTPGITALPGSARRPGSHPHLDEGNAVGVAELVDADALSQGGVSRNHHLQKSSATATGSNEQVADSQYWALCQQAVGQLAAAGTAGAARAAAGWLQSLVPCIISSNQMASRDARHTWNCARKSPDRSALLAATGTEVFSSCTASLQPARRGNSKAHE